MDWLAAAQMAGSVLGIGGQSSANRANERMAQKQMDFQSRMAHSAQDFSERMASTSAQRSVKDYLAAGLNPALAYERGAAAPAGVTAGGAASRSENVMRDAPQMAASALAVKQMKQSMEIAKAQSDADLAIKAHTKNKEEATAENIVAQSHQLRQLSEFQLLEQPSTLRFKQAEAAIRALGITGAENDQELEAKIQAIQKKHGGAGGSVKTLLQVIKSIIR